MIYFIFALLLCFLFFNLAACFYVGRSLDARGARDSERPKNKASILT